MFLPSVCLVAIEMRIDDNAVIGFLMPSNSSDTHNTFDFAFSLCVFAAKLMGAPCTTPRARVRCTLNSLNSCNGADKLTNAAYGRLV